jgi:poly(A) polymerase
MDPLNKLSIDFLPDCTTGIYLVGGTLRDLLDGRSPSDIDLAVQGDLQRVAAAIVRKTGGHPINIGNKGFAVIRIAAPTAVIDITPVNGPTIEADLASRDFTINAMAYDLTGHRLVDCFGGRSDIERKTVRMVSPDAFKTDPARLVRTYRMAAVLGYAIDNDTRRAITRHRQRIGGVAGERVWAELVKTLGRPHAAPTVRDMADDGLLVCIFPELAPTVGCVQNAYHQFDVFSHSLLACEHLEHLLTTFEARFPGCLGASDAMDLVGQAYLLKYAALLHDIGKPGTRQVTDDGRVRFLGHAARSADLADAANRRLRLSRRERQTTHTIIRHHIRPLSLFLSADREHVSTTPPRRSRIRFFNRCGDATLPILVHAMADIMAKADRLDRAGMRFIDYCHHLIIDYGHYRRQISTAPPLITGDDLIQRLALPPSPQFRQILARVDERRLAGELKTRADAIAWVRQWLKNQPGDGDA